MALSDELIDFDVIENQKENIQSIPSGRSAKSLANVFSPLAAKALPPLSQSQDKNDEAREAFEKELALIDESDDPLDVYDRYVKWTMNTYPSAQATKESRLLPLLERATKAFRSSQHYRNDPRYLRLWLTYIHLFSDAPRETYAYLSRHGVGDSLALYYEEFAAWLETAGRWRQAEEVYRMGIEKEAQPVARLSRKFGEFQKRHDARPLNTDEPSSPALPKVRSALATKTDPFSGASSPEDPQAADRRAAAAPTKSKKQKLQIFSDNGEEQPRPASGGDAAQGWENIGTVAERRKENMVETKTWTGETLGGGASRGKAAKMMVFKDQRFDPKLTPNLNDSHPSREQRLVNARTGKHEHIAINLSLVYPDPTNPAIEFCFEEVRAARRGLLYRNFDMKKTNQVQRPDSPLEQAAQTAVESDIGASGINRNTKIVEEPPKTFEQKIRLNDVDDENNPHDNTMVALSKAEMMRQMRREEKANKTRKIKVKEVKSETQTIQTNFDSPQKPRIRRKKEPTMTLHTKEANDEIYDLFNQPFKPEDGVDDETSDVESVDEDDYTSGGDSTVGTGRISAASSDFGDETQGDVTETQADLTETTRTGDDIDVASEAEMTSNTGWTDFDTKKDVSRGQEDDSEDEDEANETGPGEDSIRQEMTGDMQQSGGNADHQTLTIPTSPSPPTTDNHETRYVPLPPEDFEAPTRPYRNPEEVAQSRLPFMTPIAERTESSLGAATAQKERDFFNSKTPCSKGRSQEQEESMTPLGQSKNDYKVLEGNPFGDIFDDTKDLVSQPVTKSSTPPKLASTTSSANNKPIGSTATFRARQALTNKSKEPIQKGPVIKEAQCNPLDEQIRDTIMKEMYPAVSSFEGFYDHSSEDFGRKSELKKHCKSRMSSSGHGKGNERDRTPSATLKLQLPGSSHTFNVRRELGAGAFAPVYLVDSIPTTEDNGSSENGEDKENEGPIASKSSIFAPSKPSRHSQEAVKMEDPPNAYEFHMIRTLHRRLSGLPRAVSSLVSAPECHLFRDECYLFLTYRPHGTLLDLVNSCARDQTLAGTGGSGMDESLAMFFAIELLRTVEVMHSKGIIHCDLKADNVMVRIDGSSAEPDRHLEQCSSGYSASGRNGWSSRGISLIDFGRSIDMKAFPSNVGFIADWQTGPTDCAEMRELRPWTYQADYFGLAAILHTLLFGKYIETVVEKTPGTGPSARRYKLKEGLKRYWQADVWGGLFDMLLNSARWSQEEANGEWPLCKGLKERREAMESWLEGEGGRRGAGLGGLWRRVEGVVSGKGR